MKRGLIIGLTIAALGIAASFASAGSYPPEPVTEADALPAYEILTTVREMGLDPNTEPVRRGPYYVLHAIDPLGVVMRVVADAALGDILSVVPARPYDFVPYFFNGPRIIEVPQAGDRDRNYDDSAEPAPPPRPRAKPKPKHHSAAPLPLAQHRAVLSAPPPPAQGPSPIYPTPNFGIKTDGGQAAAGEKFGPPQSR